MKKRKQNLIAGLRSSKGEAHENRNQRRIRKTQRNASGKKVRKKALLEQKMEQKELSAKSRRHTSKNEAVADRTSRRV